MDKEAFKKELLRVLDEELGKLRRAAESAQSGARGDEVKSDGKYDTRAIEAGYLAGAQARRVAEFEEAVVLYRRLQVKNFGPDDAVAISALVELDCDGTSALYFLGPQAGGLRLVYEGRPVVVITPRSPIGRRLTGGREGDTFKVRSGNVEREYEIVRVF